MEESTKQKEFKIDKKMINDVLNYMIDQADYYKQLAATQKQAIETLFKEHEELIDKYEDLFETMLIEDDEVELRNEVINLKESLRLAESLLEFSDNKNENKDENKKWR